MMTATKEMLDGAIVFRDFFEDEAPPTEGGDEAEWPPPGYVILKNGNLVPRARPAPTVVDSEAGPSHAGTAWPPPGYVEGEDGQLQHVAPPPRPRTIIERLPPSPPIVPPEVPAEDVVDEAQIADPVLEEVLAALISLEEGEDTNGALNAAEEEEEHEAHM